MSKLVVVTDFDGTLMEHDVGDTIMEELGITETEEFKQVTRQFYEKRNGSKEWVLTSYGLVQSRKEELDAVVDRMEPRAGASDFLRFCREQSIPVSVLSDGMEYYIRRIMRRHGLQTEQVIANPIRYEDDGSFSLGVQNSNEACSWCGCCKADAVRGMKSEGSLVIYIGDGVSDTYGSAFADWVFARGSLARYLAEEKQPYYPFETFYDILDVLTENLALFRAGTAERRAARTHPFCRFV